MERKEKITLLNNIAKGIIKVDSLKPQRKLLKMVMGEIITYRLDYRHCTKEEYEAVLNSSSGKKYDVTLNLDVIQSGRPVITSESQLIEQMKSDGEWTD